MFFMTVTIIVWLLRNFFEASIYLFRYLQLGNQLKPLGTTSTGIMYKQSEPQIDLLSAVPT